MLLIILFYSLQFLLNSFDFLSSLCRRASAGYTVHIARFRIFGVELVLSATRRTTCFVKRRTGELAVPSADSEYVNRRFQECWWGGLGRRLCLVYLATLFPQKRSTCGAYAQKNTFALKFSQKSSLSKREHVVRAVVCWIAIRRFETGRRKVLGKTHVHACLPVLLRVGNDVLVFVTMCLLQFVTRCFSLSPCFVILVQVERRCPSAMSQGGKYVYMQLYIFYAFACIICMHFSIKRKYWKLDETCGLFRSLFHLQAAWPY